MSRTVFDDECKDCRPILIDAKTGQVMASDASEMRAINGVWEATTSEERRAFHNVCCNNSRTDADLTLCNGLISRVEASLRALTKDLALN